jgi:CheY-like chemotaxis protein
MAKILLVEDEEQVRVMLRTVLETAGHDVQEATNGEEAITKYHQNPADLIVTDIVMPEKEGIETIITLRKSNPELKIIAMSGGGRTSAHDYLHLAKKLGADYTLAKPFLPDQLLESVNQLLKQEAVD